MNNHDVIQLQRSYLCLAFAFFLFLVRSELDHFNLLVSLAFAFFLFCCRSALEHFHLLVGLS